MPDHDRSVEQHGFWFGTEVEGYLKETLGGGLFTVIIRKPPADLWEAMALNGKPIEHAFLTEEFDDWDWLARFMRMFPGPVTVGCNAKDVDRLKHIKTLDSWLRVIVRYWDKQVAELLSDEDEISVGEPFNLLTFRAAEGVRTVPSDYTEDTV